MFGSGKFITNIFFIESNNSTPDKNNRNLIFNQTIIIIFLFSSLSLFHAIVHRSRWILNPVQSERWYLVYFYCSLRTVASNLDVRFVDDDDAVNINVYTRKILPPMMMPMPPIPQTLHTIPKRALAFSGYVGTPNSR